MDLIGRIAEVDVASATQNSLSGALVPRGGRMTRRSKSAPPAAPRTATVERSSVEAADNRKLGALLWGRSTVSPCASNRSSTCASQGAATRSRSAARRARGGRRHRGAQGARNPAGPHGRVVDGRRRCGDQGARSRGEAGVPAGVIRTPRRTIAARGRAQAFLVSMRFADRGLVFGIGPAGTGKTYLAVAAAASFLCQRPGGSASSSRARRSKRASASASCRAI